jgi:hypothetical protein
MQSRQAFHSARSTQSSVRGTRCDESIPLVTRQGFFDAKTSRKMHLGRQIGKLCGLQKVYGRVIQSAANRFTPGSRGLPGRRWRLEQVVQRD